jgi:hypothetical protein
MRVRLINMEQRKATIPGKEKSRHPAPHGQTVEVLNSEMTIGVQPHWRWNHVPHMSMCYTRPSYKDKA